MPLTGEARGQAGCELYAVLPRGTALSGFYRLAVDIQQRGGAAELVVFVVGDDMVLKCRVDESIDELAVGSGDCPFVRSDVRGELAESLPLVWCQLQIRHSAIEEP